MYTLKSTEEYEINSEKYSRMDSVTEGTVVVMISKNELVIRERSSKTVEKDTNLWKRNGFLGRKSKISPRFRKRT